MSNRFLWWIEIESNIVSIVFIVGEFLQKSRIQAAIYIPIDQAEEVTIFNRAFIPWAGCAPLCAHGDNKISARHFCPINAGVEK